MSTLAEYANEANGGDGRLVLLALLTEGLPDKEFSRRLVISEQTVHHHVSAVLSKIGVPSRAAAIREAAKMGIGTPI